MGIQDEMPGRAVYWTIGPVIELEFASMWPDLPVIKRHLIEFGLQV